LSDSTPASKSGETSGFWGVLTPVRAQSGGCGGTHAGGAVLEGDAGLGRLSKQLHRGQIGQRMGLAMGAFLADHDHFEPVAQADGTKHIKAEYLYQGEWQTAIAEGLTSPAE
jgi:hypothetical protein